MIVRACYVVFWVLSSGALALAQFGSVPLGDPLLNDIAVTLCTNSTTWSRVEWTEYSPAAENVTTPAPYPGLLETPFPINQVRSCTFAALDGDDETDWVLLVHHGPGRLSTVEHWEGNENGMALQRVLIEAAPAPAEMIALTFGDLDGDTSPDILTIEDPTGNGPQVVRHYEQSCTEWFLVTEFLVGAPTDHFVVLTVGNLDGDSLTDVLLIRDDEQGDNSAIDQYHFSGGQLTFVRNLVTEPRDTHRFQALDLGTLGGDRTDLLILDWFFFQLVHEVQRWEFTGNEIQLFRIVREAIPPAERLIDISIASPICGDNVVNQPSEQCAPDPLVDADDGLGGDYNRVGDFKMPASAGAQEVTIRVKLNRMYIDSDEDASQCPVRQGLPDLQAFEGQVRYLGPPEVFDNNAASDPKWVGAKLQCTQLVRDWSPSALTTLLGGAVNTDTIYYYGAEVVPCSIHSVQQATQSCVDSASEDCFSAALEVRTGLWGDVWPPFGNVNFSDIGAEVDAFKTIAYGEDGPTACP